MVMGRTGMAALVHSWWTFPSRRFCIAIIHKEFSTMGGHWQHVTVPARRWWSPSFKAISPFFQEKLCRLSIILKRLPRISFVISFSVKEMVPVSRDNVTKLPLKTYSVRYILQNKSKTKYPTIFLLCAAFNFFNICTSAYHKLHVVILIIIFSNT